MASAGPARRNNSNTNANTNSGTPRGGDGGDGGGRNARSWRIVFVRVARAVFLVLTTLAALHVVCAVANNYTTKKYLELAQSLSSSTERRHQYASPLYDMFFFGHRDDWCSPTVQAVYDLVLWVECAHVIRIG